MPTFLINWTANFEISNNYSIWLSILLLNEEGPTENLKYSNLLSDKNHYVHNLQILPFYFILIYSFRGNSKPYLCPIPAQSFTTYFHPSQTNKRNKRDCLLVNLINVLPKWNKKENKTNLYKQYSLWSLVVKKQALFFDLRKKVSSVKNINFLLNTGYLQTMQFNFLVQTDYES